MLDRANDLITYRIDSVLDEIATMSLCDLPDDEPIPPEEFLHHTQVNSDIPLTFRLLFLCSNRLYVIMHQNKFK
jgi:hypothetical protein